LLTVIGCGSSSGSGGTTTSGGGDGGADGSSMSGDDGGATTTPTAGTDGGSTTTSGTGDGGGTTTSGGGDGGVSGNPASAASYFPPSIYFNVAIDGAPLDPQSATIISALAGRGGWGHGNVFQIDPSIDVYYADASSKYVPFDGSDATAPDSDIPTTVPLDPSKPIGFESSTGYASDGGDSHYLVMDLMHRQLIELDQADYNTSIPGKLTTVGGGSVAIWSFDKAYLGSLRGDVCTSADASGGMMAPLLFTAEEVAAGHIDHAIRFILPNDRIEWHEFVRPATHATGQDKTMTGWATSNGVPYGARFRLHAGYDISGLKPGAQVIAKALKKYGMILSDGGEIALSAKSDQYSMTKWSGLLDVTDLSALKVTDFDMVAASYGTDMESSTVRHDFATYDCVRNP
jgi:serine/threonine-protein kinase